MQHPGRRDKSGVPARNPFYLLIVFSFSLIVFSCQKDPIREVTNPPNPPPPDDTTTYCDGFFIVNEGNFNWGNSSITFVNTKNGTVHHDIFKTENHYPLGDVAQSMKVFNDRVFIVVNNSNKVEVVDLKTFKSIKTVDGFNYPRYIEFIDSNKAYVTNLYKDISVLDLNTLSISKVIQTPEWTEGMVKYQQFMFVTCIGTFNEPNSKRKAKLLIIETKEDRIIDSIQTGKEPMGIVIDKKLKLWVLCSGGWDGYESPALIRINPELRQVEKAFSFSSSTALPNRLNINPTGDTLYYLREGIYHMPVTAASLPDQPFIPSNGRLYYGLAVHPVDGTIFASDAVDYVQNGKAFQFTSSTGTQTHAWDAGRIPGAFCFGETRNPKTLK